MHSKTSFSLKPKLVFILAFLNLVKSYVKQKQKLVKEKLQIFKKLYLTFFFRSKNSVFNPPTWTLASLSSKRTHNYHFSFSKCSTRTIGLNIYVHFLSPPHLNSTVHCLCRFVKCLSQLCLLTLMSLSSSTCGFWGKFCPYVELIFKSGL